jgi:phosphotriesterase-related protein
VEADAEIEMSNVGDVRRNPLSYYQNLVLDHFERQLEEVSYFKRAGGQTIVELTPEGIGRDVEGCRAIAQATGLNIIRRCS